MVILNVVWRVVFKCGNVDAVDIGGADQRKCGEVWNLAARLANVIDAQGERRNDTLRFVA